MAQPGQTTIQLYSTTTAATTPSPSNLVSGELALNLTDKKIFSKDGSGTVVEMSMSPLNPSYTGTLTGGTGTVNLGSGQFVKDIYGNVGLNTTPSYLFDARSASSIVARLQSTTSGAYLSFLDNGGINGYVRIGASNNDLVLMSGNNINGTLNAAGNLGLGVVPSAWLSGAKAIDITRSAIADENGTLTLTSNAFKSATGWTYKVSTNATRMDSDSGQWRWYTAPSGTAGDPISFTQAMTLDDSGNLNVNTTGAAGNRFFVVQSGAGNVAARFQNSVNNYGAYNIYSVLDGTGNATTSCNHFVAFSSGADVFAVRGNGNVVNTNNSYGAISDLKLKENVTDASPKLAKLMQVRIVNYTLKADPTKAKLIGVIAQELEQISPGLIEEAPDFEEVKKTREVEVPAVDAVLDDEGNEVTPATKATTRTEEYTERVDLGTTTKSVKYSVFVPMLIKGMQEQQAQIEAMQSQLDAQNTAMQLLADRLAALESA